MKMPGNMIFTIVAFLAMVLSFSLFSMGSYPLSTGSSYLLAGESSTFINILSLLGGSFLGLANIFLIFFVYLPVQKEERLEKLRDTLAKARKKASEEQEQFNNSPQADEEGIHVSHSKSRMKTIGTRLTVLAGFLAFLFGVAIFFVEIFVSHANAGVHGFVFFTAASAFFLIIGVLLLIMQALFRKM